MAFPVHCAHALEVDLGDLDETRGPVDRLVELGYASNKGNKNASRWPLEGSE